MEEHARTTKTQRKEEDKKDQAGRTIEELPEECLAKAISLTSPADACRAAAVSAAFRMAADSDAVWERFLPPDCDAILERAVHLVDIPSRKELFLELSDDDEHILLDDGKMTFGLQRSNGVKRYMLSASHLEIAWGKIDLYWIERSDPDSRFSTVAELISVCWLSIYGVINSRQLSPGTHYAGYLVFKLTHNASSLASPRQISFVEVRGQLVGRTRMASLHLCTGASCSDEDGTTMTMPHEHEQGGGVVRYPRPRVDGWLELEMGDFHTGTVNDESDVRITMQEFEDLQWKKGLIIEGIEIRPKT